MAKLFQTGDSSNDDLSKVTLELTTDVWFRRALLRALILLTQEENWQQDGLATIDYARDKANEMYVSIAFDVAETVTTPVGSIMFWVMDTPPDRWIICDGSGYLKAEYPELWALWGTKYGTSPDFFGSPNLVDRVPYGKNVSQSIDDTFGAATHTLTLTEIPSHSHTPSNGGNFLVNGGTGTKNHQPFAGSLGLAIAATNAQGGGASHNNLQPSYAGHFIAYGGVAP